MTQSGHLERSTGGASDRKSTFAQVSGYLGGLNDSRKLCPPRRTDFCGRGRAAIGAAVGGWPVTVGAAYSIPLWASWIACVVAAVIAVLAHLEAEAQGLRSAMRAQIAAPSIWRSPRRCRWRRRSTSSGLKSIDRYRRGDTGSSGFTPKGSCTGTSKKDDEWANPLLH